MFELLQSLLIKITGFRIIKERNYLLLNEKSESNRYELLELLKASGRFVDLIRLEQMSQSQYLQDLMVCFLTNFKKEGFFVEFGAANGVYLSNTHLLEKEYQCTGILAEPARKFKQDLIENRNCSLDFRCVYTDTGGLVAFKEVDQTEFSTIKRYSGADLHKKTRKKGVSYSVETVTLSDLLIAHKAPAVIDYLSLDTEGSEYEILKDFPFGCYSFKIITVEHNFNANRYKTKKLLEANGYIAIMESISQRDFWFVAPDLIENSSFMTVDLFRNRS